ncbi:MAG: alpha/beta hydrolase [Proteobacteria bacterium]|nr:alpha/beta hydrolase [Pseudomonadota bacterium]
MRFPIRGLAPLAVALSLVTGATHAQTAAPAGELSGKAFEHTPASAATVVAQANVALPAAVTGGPAFFGKWRDAPKEAKAQVPVVVFLHGSSGLGLAAIEEWQRWLAGIGIASVAPDSFALPDRVTYKSPIPRDTYEKIHRLRASEIALALKAVGEAPWADRTRLVLAGTSEGATAVARAGAKDFAARLIFSWSCEDNYFVEAHATQVVGDQPVLNVISSVDPFFSPSNGWLGNPAARGHCAAAFAESGRAVIVLIPGAPHTLINLPFVRGVTQSFLETALKK